jgi:hypothetical protein
MSNSTIELQNTYNWAYGFTQFEPLSVTAAAGEPALTNANTVYQAILGPPFRWNFNRSTVSFPCTAGTQDYATSVPTFGFIESASTTLSGASYAIDEVKQTLTVSAAQGRPKSIAAQIDNNSGTITFRLIPVPDQAYTVTVTFQAAALTLFTGLSQTWAPIPDKFSYIYNYGFLALSLAYADDARFPMFNQKFVAHLLGAQQGLTETERNLFIDTWNLITRQENLNAIKTQQGRASLGV